MYGVPTVGFLFIVCIILAIIICVLVCKKDTDLLNLMQKLPENSQHYIQSVLEMQTHHPTVTDTTTVTGSPAQRNSQGGVTMSASRALCCFRTSSHDQQPENGGLEDVDSDNPVPPLRQQQSNTSSNFAHKGNPVYHLVKKSMRDAKFPERRYRRLKEELRSTCEKCKKEQ